MKKIIIFLCLFGMISINIMAKNTDMLEFKIGGNLSGKYDRLSDTNFPNKTNPKGLGIEGIVELNHRPIPNIITGLGTGYQRNEKVELDNSDGDKNYINTIPIYATLKYVFNLEGKYQPYLKANLGVAIPYTRNDLKKTGVLAHTGLYYAVGGGLEYNKFIVDLSYQYSEGNVKGDYGSKIRFSRVTLGVGYRLSIL